MVMKKLSSGNVRKENWRSLQIIGVCMPFQITADNTTVYSQLPNPSILMENMRKARRIHIRNKPTRSDERLLPKERETERQRQRGVCSP